jgi:hypothetical protein
LRFADFERQLRRLLGGQPFDSASAPPALGAALAPLDAVWEQLRRLMPAEPIDWLAWLREPHTLAEKLRAAPDGTLRQPLADLRMSCWLGEPRVLTSPQESRRSARSTA